MQREKFQQLLDTIGKKTTLVAVSKLQPEQAIRKLYTYGQRDFGENYVQELVEKQLVLPHDIHWHFIGHLQSNKIKYIAPFIHLIHSVDSFKLLMEIDRQGKKINRRINCLLQVHIAMEDTKYGLFEGELYEMVDGIMRASEMNQFDHIKVCGLMGMASNSYDEDKVRAEFKYLSILYDKYTNIIKPNFHFQKLSMGMTSDYKIALQEGSNMLRIGSLLFGQRVG